MQNVCGFGFDKNKRALCVHIGTKNGTYKSSKENFWGLSQKLQKFSAL